MLYGDVILFVGMILFDEINYHIYVLLEFWNEYLKYFNVA